MGTVRVAGVVVGRIAIDGRPGHTPEQIREMAARFQPDTAPILSVHGGPVIGWLDGLTVEAGHDLRFWGSVIASPDILARVRDAVGVSPEVIIRGSQLLPPHPGRSHDLTQPNFRGQLQDGYNLVALAMTDTPAAPGSLMWLEPAADRRVS